MIKSSIYSIGHGNKDLKTLIEELNSFNIEYVFDVRSKPYSKFYPQYNKNSLEIDLASEGITYVFLGNYLGGLPDDITCYIDGKVQYNLVREKSFFQAGINLLIDANKENLTVALLCSETKPEDCHRCKLIGQEMLLYKISVQHIISTHKVKKQEKVFEEITKGKNTSNLFGEETNFTSKKNY
ncbi:uncharacterized protein (DUF488 family) [Flavobacterium gossypii]|uniref:Uncharacterized protein (DUF488 family) n=1 Tax=Flavobacterium gossypii TaxID=1646119 RepID=A0ABR6DRU5_9FLAO|nr:DUF488 domain-containing protein [Flavobacterium gossypii]MBA9074159.1 uncharacterized protein (DUF488 family) [Flavobacterium gossypii]